MEHSTSLRLEVEAEVELMQLTRKDLQKQALNVLHCVENQTQILVQMQNELLEVDTDQRSTVITRWLEWLA